MAPIKKHLTMVDKAKALAWKDTKMTYKEIAARLHCSLSSIEWLFSKARNSGGIPARKKGSGAPRKVTKEMEYIIKKAIEENPKLTSQEIIKQNKKLCNISSRTVRRILKEKFPNISVLWRDGWSLYCLVLLFGGSDKKIKPSKNIPSPVFSHK